MRILLRWTACVPLAAAMLLTFGCAQPPLEMEILLNPPVVEPEPQVVQDATLMERFQELSRLFEAEQIKARALEKSLTQESEGRERAETELAVLRKKAQVLEQKASAFEDIKSKYDDAQKHLLDLTDTIRELRRGLYEEKIARVKNEQTIVALRIASAKERRRQVVSNEIDVRRTSPDQDDGDHETNLEVP